MSSPASSDKFPHVKGVRRYAFGALVIALLSGAWLVLQGEGAIFGADVPASAMFGALALGALVAAVGITRRSDVLSGIAVALLALGVIPAGIARPSIATYALGLLFGLGLLLTVELVHMTGRYERAHRAVERENVPEAHVNRVIDEARKTLTGRAGLAALAVALAIALAFALATWGPRQWRAAVETTAPLGIAVVALALAGLASLFILARGAQFRFRRESPPKELLPDAAE